MAIGNPCKKGDMAIVIGGPPENIGLPVQITAGDLAGWEVYSRQIKLIGCDGQRSHYCHNVPDADLQPIRGEKSCPSLTQVNSQGEKSKVSDQSSISQEESLAS